MWRMLTVCQCHQVLFTTTPEGEGICSVSALGTPDLLAEQAVCLCEKGPHPVSGS
jgi:hypothetical protein